MSSLFFFIYNGEGLKSLLGLNAFIESIRETSPRLMSHCYNGHWSHQTGNMDQQALGLVSMAVV